MSERSNALAEEAEIMDMSPKDYRYFMEYEGLKPGAVALKSQVLRSQLPDKCFACPEISWVAGKIEEGDWDKEVVASLIDTYDFGQCGGPAKNFDEDTECGTPFSKEDSLGFHLMDGMIRNDM